MNYTMLQADIADYLQRTDLTAKIPSFIALAETSMFREINIKDIQTAVTLATVGEYLTLPADFGSIVRLTTTVGSIEKTLDYISPVERRSDGHIGNYGFENGQIRVYGAGSTTTVKLYYTPLIAPLSASVATNWLLDNAKDLYLYASALEGAKYLRDETEAAALGGMVSGLIDSVRRLSERKWQPSSGSLQIKPRR